MALLCDCASTDSDDMIRKLIETISNPKALSRCFNFMLLIFYLIIVPKIHRIENIFMLGTDDFKPSKML